jgi:20S proteasome subunit alpha 2
MGPDSRVLVKRARKIAEQYVRTYGEAIPVKELVRDVAAVMQEFTQSGYVGCAAVLQGMSCLTRRGVRPFGVALLVCGHDECGFHLYQVSVAAADNNASRCVVRSIHRDRFGRGRRRRSGKDF